MDTNDSFDALSAQADMMLSIAAQMMQQSFDGIDFLQRFREAVVIMVPDLFTGVPEKEKDKAAFWMGFNIWNAAPQAANQYKPAPLPRPERNQPCPCGSGQKFKRCCSHLATLVNFDIDSLWPYIVDAMNRKDLIAQAKQRVIPPHALGYIADRAMQEGDYKLVIQLLDPCFEGAASTINHKHSGLMDILVDAYNMHYKTDTKKKTLLERLTRHKDRVIRADAWQRIATWQQDMGNITASREALQQAMRADPDNPSHSLLELTLLVSINEIEHARNRARFWLGRLQQYQYDYPELISTLHQATKDPLAALQKQYGQILAGSDDRLDRLHFCIEQAEARAIPKYSAETSDEDDELFGKITCGVLEPPKLIQKLERLWQGINPASEPFSVSDYTSAPDSTWDDPDDEEWIEFLEQNPEAMDSFIILDSILSLLANSPTQGELPFVDPWAMQVANRGVQIIKNNVTGFRLLWPYMENRPALRLLTNRIFQLMDEGELEQYIALAEYYIKINPIDNHGLRCELINHYLKQNNNQQALALSQQYPNDGMAEISYGRVLACYSSGQTEQAEHYLEDAYLRLPLVAEYLLKSKVRQPEINPYGITHGGEEEAWVYRNEMRETWKAHPGSLNWLKEKISIFQIQ